VSAAKDLLKRLIATTCSPRLQQRIRRLYLVHQAAAQRGFHEPELRALPALIRQGDETADVGANAGVYTQELSRLVGATGHVYAFEPLAANYDVLRAVMERLRLANATAYRTALAAQCGEREMTVPKVGDFTGYYWARFAQPGEVGERVAVATLDSLWERRLFPSLDFIKCDVEGSELEVLQGGISLLRTHAPALLIEVSRDASVDVFALLRDLGYRAFVYDGTLAATPGYRDKEFSNYFFLRPDSKTWRRAQVSGCLP
jgi:FkbM family methyltransferase